MQLRQPGHLSFTSQPHVVSPAQSLSVRLTPQTLPLHILLVAFHHTKPVGGKSSKNTTDMFTCSMRLCVEEEQSPLANQPAVTSLNTVLLCSSSLKENVEKQAWERKGGSG